MFKKYNFYITSKNLLFKFYPSFIYCEPAKHVLFGKSSFNQFCSFKCASQLDFFYYFIFFLNHFKNLFNLRSIKVNPLLPRTWHQNFKSLTIKFTFYCVNKVLLAAYCLNNTEKLKILSGKSMIGTWQKWSAILKIGKYQKMWLFLFWRMFLMIKILISSNLI